MKSVKTYCLFILLLFLFNTIIYSQWKQVNMPGSYGGAVYSICFKDSLLYAGIQGGVFVSSDDGKHWETVNPDIPSRENNSMVTSIVANNKNIIAAFFEPGVYVSSDNGEDWTKADIQGGLRTTPSFLSTEGNWILGASTNGKTYQSTDNGLSWTSINGFGPVVSSVCLQDSVALIGNNSIYLSTDLGSSWFKVHHTYGQVSAIALLGSKVFAGASIIGGKDYILSSSDKGVSWKPDSVFLNCESINSIIFSPADSATEYVFAGTDSGIFRSSDNFFTINSKCYRQYFSKTN